MNDPLAKNDEGPLRTYSLRMPKALVDRLDAAAESTGNTRTDVIVRLLGWALDERERQISTVTKKR